MIVIDTLVVLLSGAVSALIMSFVGFYVRGLLDRNDQVPIVAPIAAIGFSAGMGYAIHMVAWTNVPLWLVPIVGPLTGIAVLTALALLILGYVAVCLKLMGRRL